MRFAIAALTLLSAAPAHATGGFLCALERGPGPKLSLVIGHGVPGGIVGASLDEGEGWRSTMEPGHDLLLAQTWIDRERLWIDLADGRSLEPFGGLRARILDYEATGTLEWRGRSYKVRCVES